MFNWWCIETETKSSFRRRRCRWGLLWLFVFCSKNEGETGGFGARILHRLQHSKVQIETGSADNQEKWRQILAPNHHPEHLRLYRKKLNWRRREDWISNVNERLLAQVRSKDSWCVYNKSVRHCNGNFTLKYLQKRRIEREDENFSLRNQFIGRERRRLICWHCHRY